MPPSTTILLSFTRPPTVTEFGPLDNPRLCVMAVEGDSQSVHYKWQVLFNTVSHANYSESVLVNKRKCVEGLYTFKKF